MKILALDIGVNLAWCCGATEDGRLTGTSVRLARGTADHRVYAGQSLTTLIDIMTTFKPDRVFFDFSKGVIAGKQDARRTDIDVILIHAGLRWAILGVASMLDILAEELPASAAAQKFLRARSDKGESKRNVQRECRIRGIPFESEHHADSIAIWHAAAFKLDPDFAARDAVARMRMRDPFANAVLA